MNYKMFDVLQNLNYELQRNTIVPLIKIFYIIINYDKQFKLSYLIKIQLFFTTFSFLLKFSLLHFIII